MEYRPPQQDRFLSEKPTPWWHLIPCFLFLPVVFLLFWVFGGDGPDALAAIDLRGGRVLDDQELAAQLAGAVELSDEFVVGVACQNGVEWERDVNLDSDSLIATSPGLVRAAELVASGTFSAEFVVAVEKSILQEGNPESGAPIAGFDGLDPEELSSYLEARAEPPSEAATRRFGAYAASSATTRRYVALVDLESLDRKAIWQFGVSGHGVDAGIAGQEGIRSVGASECRAFSGDAFETTSGRVGAALRAVSFLGVLGTLAIGFGLVMRATTEPWWRGQRRVEPQTVRRLGMIPIAIGLGVLLLAAIRLLVALVG